jgi:hypothetical protein
MSPALYSALVSGFDPDWLRGKENSEDLAEDQFFHKKRDCHRKDQACDHCQESDDELHMCSPFVLGMEWQSAVQSGCRLEWEGYETWRLGYLCWNKDNVS